MTIKRPHFGLETLPALPDALPDTPPDAPPDAIVERGRAAIKSPRPARNRTRSTSPTLIDAAAADLPGPGTRLGHYELIRSVGRGGMGSVFLARDLRLGRRVAIKFLTSGCARVGERFRVEARATARCQHPNIVVIHDIGEYQSRQYMVLEYVSGQTLRDLLAQHEASNSWVGGKRPTAVDAHPAGITPARAVELMVPVVRALARAHAMGIVHRDLKPGNIMLTRDGRVKVLDFGVAMLRRVAFGGGTGAGDILTGAYAPVTPGGSPGGEPGSVDELAGFSPSSLVGTPAYMSPEQLEGRDVDHQSDIWAVGVMLHELVMGEHPLGACTARDLLDVADLDVPMPRVSDLYPEAGPLAGVIDRCLLKDKRDRLADARALLAELEPLLPGHGRLSRTGDDSPFVGLNAFQEGDADRFFGRDEDTRAVVSRVREQPLVAVIGPSGAGKSSLVRAGVIPALERSGEGWQSLIARPGREPLTALAQVLDRLARTSTASGRRVRNVRQVSTLDGDAPVGVPATVARLRAEPGYFGAALRTHAQRKLHRVLLFIDQFEEVYTLSPDDSERAAFLACLEGAADDDEAPLRLVLSMRADFLERMAESRSFMELATPGLMLLPPMGRAGLQAALEKPLELAGYQFESGDVVRDMLDGLNGTRGALPLLQFAATTLWKERDGRRRLITEASYRAMGGMAGALAKHADAVIAAMTGARRKLARAVFERLVTPERTRAVVSVGELREMGGVNGDAVEAVLDELARARLVVVDAGTVEIVHESLIDGWPTLRRWLDEHEDDAAYLARLRTAAREWEKSGRAAGMLWSGELADEARRWQRHYAGQLPELEQRYLEAVFERSQRTRVRRRRLIYAGMAAVVLVVLAGAIAFTKAQNESALQTERDLVQAQNRDLQRQSQKLQASEAQLRASRDRLRQALQQSESAQAAEADAREREAHRARDAERAGDEVRRLLAETNRQRKRALTAAENARKAREDMEKAWKEAENLRQEAIQTRDEIDSQKRFIEELIERQGIRKVDLPDDTENEPLSNEEALP